MLELIFDVTIRSILQLGKTQLSLVDQANFSPGGWTRFTELMSLLVTYKRLVFCADVAPNICQLQNACDCTAELAFADVVIKGSAGMASAPDIQLASYTHSGVRADIRNYDESLTAEMPRADFETTHLAKMLMLASEVTIIDRVLGKYWSTSVGFAHTMNWLVSHFKVAGISNIILVSSATGASERALHAWCVGAGVDFQNRLYDELPHWRSLVTDRFTVRIDRGFDLLKTNDNVRQTDMTVKRIPNTGQAEYSSARRSKPNRSCPHC
jgi:hypothetical protein